MQNWVSVDNQHRPLTAEVLGDVAAQLIAAPSASQPAWFKSGCIPSGLGSPACSVRCQLFLPSTRLEQTLKVGKGHDGAARVDRLAGNSRRGARRGRLPRLTCTASVAGTRPHVAS
jgi:hypothetical protein